MTSLKQAALDYHKFDRSSQLGLGQLRPGKLKIVATKAMDTQQDLSLAYSPGVAYPVLEIANNPEDAYEYTAKGNLVAVISNGTAILGLGDRGALVANGLRRHPDSGAVTAQLIATWCHRSEPDLAGAMRLSNVEGMIAAGECGVVDI